MVLKLVDADADADADAGKHSNEMVHVGEMLI